MRRAARRGCVKLCPGELFGSQTSEMIFVIISAGAHECAPLYTAFTDVSVCGDDALNYELNVSHSAVKAENVKDFRRLS